MCGIAGILGELNDANRAALRRMAAAMAHRGPDGEGVWESAPDAAGLGCLLAHRRLSILDLSNAAAQPMVDAASGSALTFNGEIYNYRALRDALSAEGQRFHSTGDTEVLARLLAARGAAGVERLRGMFAFGWWDGATRRLMLARDPLGIKPLYVSVNREASRGWSLVFASEVRAILASGLLPAARINPTAVRSMVWNGFVTNPSTAVDGVESLWPGEWREFGIDSETQSKAYWFIPPANPIGSLGELEKIVRESVQLHLASDVPLGVFLSGGIDSSAVANLAQRASGQAVNTFTLVFEEGEYDERRHAKAVAEAIGTRHHEIVLMESEFVASLDVALDSIDQPSFDGLNSYYVSKAVREAGLTVALTGTGGDELFGGYSSFRHVPTFQRWSRRTRWLPMALKLSAAKGVAAFRRGAAGPVPPQTRWAKLPEMLRAGDDALRLYPLAYALFLPEFQRELLNLDASADVESGLSKSMRDRLREETAGRSDLESVSALEQRCFLGERLLRDTDAASMAVSLETRLPLVDQEVVAAVNRLPTNVRYQPLGRKQALRTIGLKGLDPALFERPKRGFVLPFDPWIRRKLGTEMDETMRDRSLAASVGLNGEAVERLWRAYRSGAAGFYWSRVWAIYILLRWSRRHSVTL